MDGMKLGPNKWVPSPALVQWIAPSLTSGTTITDRRGGSNPPIAGSAQSGDTVTGTYGVWGTTHRFRSYAHTDATRAPVYYPNALQGRYANASHSILLFFRGEFTVPGAATVFWRVGGVSTPGLRFRLGSSGVQQYYVTTDAASEALGLQTTLAAAGTVSESFAVLLDGTNKVVRVAVNGALNPATGTLPAGQIITSTTGINGFGDAAGAIAAAYQEMQAYVITGALPANIPALLASLHFRPYTPLSAAELQG